MKKPVLLLLVLALQCLGVTAKAESDIEYFKQFLYRAESIGDDPDFPTYQYRFLMATMTEIQLPNGKSVMPDITLFLLEDGTYKMLYKENVLMPKNPDGTRPFLPGRCRALTGSWTVPGASLLLDQVATGGRNFSGNKNRVALKLNADLDNPGMAGREIVLDYAYSNSGIDDNRFCF